jgi:ribosome assembly protein YihI (activator of Der GTPase)
MRNLRWAAELAVHEDDRKAQLGVAQLNALDASDLLDESQQLFIDAALDAVVSVPLEELDELGDDAFVVETDIAMTDDLRRVLESERRRREQGGDLG